MEDGEKPVRVTCLKCGSQYDVEYDTSSVAVNCECGPAISYPEVHYAGVVPSERAAERLRYRAFHSAGLVRNIGVVALTVSAVSILFFPLAIVGVGIGLYTLLGTRGPLKRYVGRQQAMAAVVLGLVVFFVEGTLALDWMEQRRIRRVDDLQASVKDDLRGLLRTQRLYRAAQDRYGGFQDFPGKGFRPINGHYTIYLGPEDFMTAVRDNKEVRDEWVGAIAPGVSADAFTAIAVANLDDDPDMDVWMLTHRGEQTHLVNDNDYRPDDPEVATDPVSPAVAPAVAERGDDSAPSPSPAPAKDGLDATPELDVPDATTTPSPTPVQIDTPSAAPEEAHASPDSGASPAPRGAKPAPSAAPDEPDPSAEADKGVAPEDASPTPESGAEEGAGDPPGDATVDGE